MVFTDLTENDLRPLVGGLLWYDVQLGLMVCAFLCGVGLRFININKFTVNRIMHCTQQAVRIVQQIHCVGDRDTLEPNHGAWSELTQLPSLLNVSYHKKRLRMSQWRAKKTYRSAVITVQRQVYPPM